MKIILFILGFWLGASGYMLYRGAEDKPNERMECLIEAYEKAKANKDYDDMADINVQMIITERNKK